MNTYQNLTADTNAEGVGYTIAVFPIRRTDSLDGPGHHASEGAALMSEKNLYDPETMKRNGKVVAAVGGTAIKGPDKNKVAKAAGATAMKGATKK